MVERTVHKNSEEKVQHTGNNSYIINSASFYSAELHRLWASIPMNEVTEEEYTESIRIGVEKWEVFKKKKAKQTGKQKGKEKATDLETTENIQD